MNGPPKKLSVFIALLTLGEREGWLHPSIAQFLVALTQQKGRQISLNIRTDTKPHDYARNLVVKDFLATGYDLLLMMDNDMGPPPNLLDMLDRAEDHMDIFVPKFYRSPDLHSWLATSGMHMRVCVESVAPEGLGENEWCELVCAGTGIMFVRRRVFERMGNEGWFRFVYDANGKIVTAEDIGFCQKARKLGFSIWVNQLFEANHYKTVPLSAVARGVRVATPGT
jgi:hypothetical protein